MTTRRGFLRDDPDAWNAAVEKTRLHLHRIRHFAARAAEHLAVAEVHLLRLESDPGNTESIDAVTRILASVRRAARILRLSDVAMYARYMEDTMKRIREGEMELPGATLDSMFDSVDVMKRHLGYVLDSAASGAPMAKPRGLRELHSSARSLKARVRVPMGEIPEDIGAMAEMRLGELLIEEGVATQEDLDAALEEQHAPMKKRVGDILFENAKVSQPQLERASLMQEKEPERGKLGEILMEMGAVQERDIQDALEMQQHPIQPKLGELLVRSERVSAKEVAHAVRKQGFLRDAVRYGLASLAARMAPCGVEGRSARLDADPEAYREFLERASDHLMTADVQLVRLESEPRDTEALDTVYRAFHGIGRMAALLRLKDIDDFSRAAEQLVDKARKGHLMMEGPVLDVALDSVLVLRRNMFYLKDALDSGTRMKRERTMASQIACVRAIAAGHHKGIHLTSMQPVVGDKRLGEILVETGQVAPNAVKAALAFQQTPPIAMKLGDILLDEAKVSRAQLDQALDAQRRDPSLGRLGDILMRAGVLDQADIDAALERQRSSERPRLGELLVKSGQASAKAVAHALRCQRAGIAGAAATIAATTILVPAGQAHAATGLTADGDSALVTVSVPSGVDTDADGLTDAVEAALGLDSRSADSDADGVPDGWELWQGMNPRDALDSGEDSDGDRVTNIEEFEAGTLPYEVDSDEDGFWDNIEIARGTDPSSADSWPYSGVFADLDADGNVNALDVQTVVNAALGLPTQVPANVNLVGAVNALDIQAVIQAVLSR